MKKGLTLVEVIVSSVILVVVIGAILMSYTQYQKILVDNNMRREVQANIDRVFERCTTSRATLEETLSENTKTMNFTTISGNRTYNMSFSDEIHIAAINTADLDTARCLLITASASYISPLNSNGDSTIVSTSTEIRL